jgi:hypothetical protein
MLQGLAATFARPGPTVFLYLEHFAGTMPHANLVALLPSIPLEWSQLAVENIHKTCCSFYSRHYILTKKDEV